MSNQKPQARPGESLPSMVDSITDDDVLYGRGSGVNYHTGNVEMRRLAIANAEAFDTATTSAARDKIALDIVREITRKGGRFLKPAGPNQWKVMSQQKAILKVKTTIRDRIHSTLTQEESKRQECSQDSQDREQNTSVSHTSSIRDVVRQSVQTRRRESLAHATNPSTSVLTLRLLEQESQNRDLLALLNLQRQQASQVPGGSDLLAQLVGRQMPPMSIDQRLSTLLDPLRRSSESLPVGLTSVNTVTSLQDRLLVEAVAQRLAQQPSVGLLGTSVLPPTAAPSLSNLSTHQLQTLLRLAEAAPAPLANPLLALQGGLPSSTTEITEFLLRQRENQMNQRSSTRDPSTRNPSASSEPPAE